MEWLIGRMLRDATSATTAHLQDLNSSIGAKIEAYRLWISMVQSGAPWDLKDEVLRTFGPNVEVRGVWYLFDILGNIHYGFVGKAAGFSDLELKKGAGAANFVDNYRNAEYRRQVIGGWWKSNFDDPSDQAAISIGMDLHRKYQLDVTPSRFYEVFSRYEHLLTRAIPQFATPATR